MIRTQQWTPDTHDAVFTLRWDDDDDPEAPQVCTEAVIAGEAQKNPQAAYETILAQNQAKNLAVAAIIEALPDEMKKPVLDSDGDPTGEMVVKDKHWPTWEIADGKIAIGVPGADRATLEALAPVLDDHGEAVALKAG